MRQLIEYGGDAHPEGAEMGKQTWVVAVTDDCDDCGAISVELVLEADGKPGTGIAAHLSPEIARRVRAALAAALQQVGEPL